MYEHQVLPPYPYIRFTRARGSAQGRTIIDWLVPKKSWKDLLLPRPNDRNNSRDFPEEPSRRLR